MTGAAQTAVALTTYGLFAVGGVALAVIDARSKLLPNRIVFPLYGVGLVGLTLASWLGHAWGAMLSALICMAAFYAVFYLIAMFGPMGFGDVKLAGLLGLYLGWISVPVAFAGILIGAVAASVGAIALILARSVRREPWRRMEIAYGPYLLFGALVAVVLGLV